ncbi:hypothetical protein [Pseudomonas mohnii]
MLKAVQATDGTIDAFKFVCRAAVSDASRTRIEQAAASLGIANVTIWSGVEFEENLRLRAEYLLHRFAQGIEFPDALSGIRRFVDDFPDLTDSEALQLMAAVFDRPAFYTPFHQESSLPAFQQGIEDTIGALNTGIWRTREGDEIRRIPSIHHLRDLHTREVLGKVVRQVDELRRSFVDGLRDGNIKRCGCGMPSCPTYMLTHKISEELDRARQKILMTFRCVLPSFKLSLR